MRRFVWVMGGLVLLLLVACSGAVEEGAESSAVLPSGPALIMFYTDN
jgi:hypothetical protein